MGVLEKVSMFLRQKMSRPWGGLEPPTFGLMPNALTYWAIRARHLLSHVVEYWLWWYKYFLSKVITGSNLLQYYHRHCDDSSRMSIRLENHLTGELCGVYCGNLGKIDHVITAPHYIYIYVCVCVCVYIYDVFNELKALLPLYLCYRFQDFDDIIACLQLATFLSMSETNYIYTSFIVVIESDLFSYNI